jgi:Tol biopolymer transport system component
MNPDGSSQRKLTDKIVTCTPPVPSNNGFKIAFTTYEDGGYNLYVIEKSGQNMQFLSKGKQYIGSPAWSHDDTKISFVKNDRSIGHDIDLYVINADGSGEKLLSNYKNNYSSQWFPNENKIVYTCYDDSWSGIYVINGDGTGRTLLTPADKSFGYPQVSPDGTKISFVSADRDGSQIFVMNANGSNIKQLTFTVSSSYYDRGSPRDGNNSPAWSPNGNKIAYVSWVDGNPDIFVINTNGTSDRRLTNNPLRDESPYWSDDGSHILYSSGKDYREMNAEVYIIDAQGQKQLALTKFVGDDIFPVWLK